MKTMDAKRVERAIAYIERHGGYRFRSDLIAGMLEAADTPEPEIVVTHGQKNAGAAAYLQFVVDTKRADMVVDLDGLAIAYRAMRPLEPIPPFTEKMREAMRDAADIEGIRRDEYEAMYQAARALENK